MERIDSDFKSNGAKCTGWLYRPEGESKPPVVVMAHGFAAQRDFGLQPFAERFAGAGMAAFLFDYRNFGDSEGEPRNLVSPRRHLQDWQAAICHVRGLPGVDATRLALWGSSYSGGHVLVTAARVRGISAVVSQVPFVGGLATATMFSPGFVLEALAKGVIDLGRAATSRPPYYVPVVGAPGTFAMMNTPESLPGYSSLIPDGSDWMNWVPARAALTMTVYSPASHAGSVTCPVLIVCAENDSLIPSWAVRKTAEKIGRSRLVSLPIGHFDVYKGAAFEFAVDEEVDFLREKLQGAAAASV
jgi:dienelactone hydrolase